MKLVIAAVLLAALPANAAVVVHETETTTGYETRSAGRTITIDGDRVRIDFNPVEGVRVADTAIYSGGKWVMLNHQLQTWFEEDKPRSLSRLTTLPAFESRLRGKPRIKTVTSAGEPLHGHATTRHVIDVDYRLGAGSDSAYFTGSVTIHAVIVTAADLPRVPKPRLLTGIAQVDEELAKLAATFAGMIVQSEITISRKIDGARETLSTTTRSVIDRIEERDGAESLFVVPKSYRNQAPTYGVPGGAAGVIRR